MAGGWNAITSRVSLSGSLRAGMAAAIIFGVLANLIFAIVLFPRWSVGLNDYMAHYASGKLAFSGQLYSSESHFAAQRAATGGGYGEAWLFVRLPYFAGFLWPFSQLPYAWAWGVFTTASIAAMVGFVRWWPVEDKRFLGTVTLISLPVFHGVLNGQDVAFLMLWLAVGAALSRSGRGFAAGLVWSLLAAKPHLFLFLPIALIAKRRWPEMRGAVAGGAILLALSFVVGGAGWIPEFRAAVAKPAIHVWSQMPNLELFNSGRGAIWFYVAGAPVACWVLFKLRTRISTIGMVAASNAAGILLAPHVFLDDCALLVPLGVTLLLECQEEWRRWLGVLVLSPIYFLLPFEPPLAYSVPLMIVAALLGLLGNNGWRSADNGHLAARVETSQV